MTSSDIRDDIANAKAWLAQGAQALKLGERHRAQIERDNADRIRGDLGSALLKAQDAAELFCAALDDLQYDIGRLEMIVTDRARS